MTSWLLSNKDGVWVRIGQIFKFTFLPNQHQQVWRRIKWWMKQNFICTIPPFFFCKLLLPFGGPILTGFILPISLPTPKLMLTENDAKSLQFSARCVYFGWSPKCWNAFRIRKSTLDITTVGVSEEGCGPEETHCFPLNLFYTCKISKKWTPKVDLKAKEVTDYSLSGEMWSGWGKYLLIEHQVFYEALNRLHTFQSVSPSLHLIPFPWKVLNTKTRPQNSYLELQFFSPPLNCFLLRGCYLLSTTG